MTEHALDPAPDAGQDPSTETPSRPRRRRRRGGRGRGGGQGGKAPSEATTGAEAAGNGESPEASGSAESATEAPSEGGGEDRSETEAGEKGSSSSGRRRTRRGSRGRGRGRSGSGATRSAKAEAAPDDAAPSGDGGPKPRPARRKSTAAERPAEQAAEDQKAPSSDGTGGGQTRRRRRRRSSGAGASAAATATAEAPAEPKTDEPRDRKPARAAPTRTARTSRRATPDRRRRRPVAVERRTEKTMLMSEHHGRLQIAVLEGRELVEHYVSRTGATSMAGNIYLGRVQNVLPGMEAAFVDVGRGRNAVLYAGEVSYDEDVDASDRRIESVLKAGQSVMVQVTKDPLKGKGARLTAQISLPGRYLVYVPDGGASGISRRLGDSDRERLRKIIKRIRPSEAGVIVRTAAESATEEELEADLERLKRMWDSIKRRSRRSRAPKLLYEEPELVERVVRDVFSPAEFQEIVTDSREVYERVAAYLRDVDPDVLDRVKFHDEKLPLFEAYHVAEQISKALERKVWLPSGGYLVVDRTEAMTVIDVNTGKAVGKTNLEQTVTATNLEAAKEIPRQLRLRDIGGIIVVDFIDMMLQSNRDKVIEVLREELAHDKTRSQVFDITPLGLLELTRKKVSAGLLEAFSEPCPTCEGRGILLTHES